mgnify:CR=1 FL=1
MLKCGDIISGDNANYKVVEYEVRDSSDSMWVCFTAFLVLEVQRTNDLMFNLHHPWFPTRAKYVTICCRQLWGDCSAQYADSDGRKLGSMDRLFPDIATIVKPICKMLVNLTIAEEQRRKQR